MGQETQGQNVCRSFRERRWIHQMGDRPVRCCAARHEGSSRLRGHSGSHRTADVHTLMDSLLFVTSVEEQHWLNVARSCQKSEDSKLDLLEVYADESSRLCEAVRELGGHAQRFTIADGDLSTREGQDALLRIITKTKPRHIWMSPECKPFCHWNQFNRMRSLRLYEKIQENQLEACVHLKLCATICKIQVHEGRQFHLEQPQGSEMMKQEEASEICHMTKEAICDQCRFGLKHPQTHEALRKRTSIRTTDPNMFETMHGQTCRGEHKHAQIAGRCRYLGQDMALSRFTAFYPKIFARKLGQIIMKFPDRHHETYPAVETEEPPAKRVRINPPSGEVSEVGEFMESIRRKLPKSGSMSWLGSDQAICQKAQELRPEMQVRLVIACKGVEKYLVTDQPMPLRRTFVMKRLSHEVVDLGMEEWTKMTKTKQRRKAVPAHVMVCIFGHHPGSVGEVEDREKTETPPLEKMTEEQKLEVSEMAPSSWTPMQTTSHGPNFLSLDEHRQSVVKRMHNNLGHPASTAFAKHLQLAGAAPEIVAAAKDYQCPSCAERTEPKKSSPGQLRESKDFNERVLMDGFDWKANDGTYFHVIHMLDEATHFHVAVERIEMQHPP